MPSFPLPTPPPKSPYAKPDVPIPYQEYPKHVKSIIHKDAKGEPRTTLVHNAEEEARHTGKEVEAVVHEIASHPQAEPEKPYVPVAYPKYIRKSIVTGRDVTVANSVEEEYHTGVLMNEDGTPLEVGPDEEAPLQVGAPKPPTLQEVMAAGYAKEVAEKIVDEEAGKARRGEKPYGDKEPEEPKFQTGGVPLSADHVAEVTGKKSKKAAPAPEPEGWDK